MRILLLAPKRRYDPEETRFYYYNWNFELFREELNRQHDVFYWGKWYSEEYHKNWKLPIPEVVDRYGPFDVILVHYNNRDYPGFNDIDILKVHIAGDYADNISKENLDRYDLHFRNHRYDIVFGSETAITERLKRKKVAPHIYLLPVSADTRIYRKLGLPKIYDVMASYCTRMKLYPHRKNIHYLLIGMGVKCFLEKALFYEHIRVINQSKICINSNFKFKFLNSRFSEVMSCGTLLLTDKPRDGDLFGFKDGENLVYFKDMYDLRDKIKYFLKHDEEREEIAQNGMKFARANLSHERQIRDNFTKIIESHLR